MNEIETYEFDRLGYLVIPNMLLPEDVARLVRVVEELEEHAVQHLNEPPRKKSGWGQDYHASPDRGYHVHGVREEGRTLLIEDFWNADPAFDFLIDYPRTMEYVHAVVRGRPTINNSEIRIRYKGNSTHSHGGGGNAQDHKYRYRYDGDSIDCMMVRMIYFIHDVANEQGAFCVTPSTHKSNMASPYENNPDEEPGTIGLEVKAGDAIFFTEALHHGGLTNHSDQTRKTIHVGYGPSWMISQNIATMDEQQHITEETVARLPEERLNFFLTCPRS